jgi:hypothetical protein
MKLTQESLAAFLEQLDCGDSSCLFAKDKSGQRTNGGCQCLQSLPRALSQTIQLWYINRK